MTQTRWTGLLVGAIILLVATGAGVLWWLQQEARGPAVAEGMQWQRDCCNVDSAYDARLRSLFLGVPEESMRQVLERQGFEFSAGNNARALWSDFACGYFADVEWVADEEGRVTAVSGDFGSACL